MPAEKARAKTEKVRATSGAERDLHSTGRYHQRMESSRIFSRARRPWLNECCYHISHRCVRNAKALQFSHQRDSFMRRLREMKDKYPVTVLNFLVGTDGYRIIDRKALRRWFMDASWLEFREWYLQASNEKWNSHEYAEEQWWEDALIVGEQSFCERVADSIPESRRSLCAYPALTTVPGLENQHAWTIITAPSYKRNYILKSQP